MILSTLASEPLPFTIEKADTDQLLEDALMVRHAAYARHYPFIGMKLETAEPEDFIDGSVVFLARAKHDSQAIGTMRVNINAGQALPMEKYSPLPQAFAGRRLAEPSRLGIVSNAFGLTAVRDALFKACLMHCVAQQVDYAVVTCARALYKGYKQWGFTDVDPAADYVAMPNSVNIPIRAMYLDFKRLEPTWLDTQHPRYRYLFGTTHLDIKLPPLAVYSTSPLEASLSKLG